MGDCVLCGGVISSACGGGQHGACASSSVCVCDCHRAPAARTWSPDKAGRAWSCHGRPIARAKPAEKGQGR